MNKKWCYGSHVPDNYDAWEAYDTEQERQAEQIPECDYCGEKVSGDHYYFINDDVICPECLESYYRKDIEFYD